MELQRCRTPIELAELEKFLRSVDLTVTGLSDASVHAWVERDGDGAVVGSTGWEVSGDGCHALPQCRRLTSATARRTRASAGRIRPEPGGPDRRAHGLALQPSLGRVLAGSRVHPGRPRAARRGARRDASGADVPSDGPVAERGRVGAGAAGGMSVLSERSAKGARRVRRRATRPGERSVDERHHRAGGDAARGGVTRKSPRRSERGRIGVVPRPEGRCPRRVTRRRCRR